MKRDFDEPREKKKIPWLFIIPLCLAVLLVLGLSYFALSTEYLSLFQVLECYVVIGICTFGALLFHEMGHLFGGIMCGYRFGFFRIGSRALCRGRKRILSVEDEVEEDDDDDYDDDDEDDDDDDEYEEGEKAFMLRHYKMAGSWGQCFMLPPRGVPYNRVSYKMYLLGGGIANLVALPFASLFLIPFQSTWYVVAIFCFISLLFALGSLIPFMYHGKPNDAYAVKLCKEDPECLRAYLNHLCILGEYAKGKSVAEMPAPWFYEKFSLSERMTTNPFIAQVWCHTADRFLINNDIFQAKVIYEAMGHAEGLYLPLRIEGLYNYLYALLLEARVEQAKIYDIPFYIQKKVKKLEPYSMSLSRYRFAHGKLVMDNTRIRNAALHHFEHVAEHTPFHGDIQDQRLLLARLDDVELHYGLWGV